MLLCDIPLEGDDEHEGEVEEWFFTEPGGTRCPFHLCQRHAAPIRDVCRHAPKGPAPGAKTIEQVEKEKAAAKAAASRRAQKKQ